MPHPILCLDRFYLPMLNMVVLNQLDVERRGKYQVWLSLLNQTLMTKEGVDVEYVFIELKMKIKKGPIL